MTLKSRAMAIALGCAVALVAPMAGARGVGAEGRSIEQERGGRRAPPPPRPVVRHPARKSQVVFIGGYFYDPFYGPYPWWPRPAYPFWYFPIYDDRAELRIACRERQAAVYVDGFYAGIVDDFDGAFQRLPLPPGGHRIALYLDGYTTAEFSVYLRRGSTFTIRHAMEHVVPGEASQRPVVSPPVPPPPTGTYAPPRGAPPTPTTSAPSPGPAGTAGTVQIRVQPATAAVLIDGERWLSSDAGQYELQLTAGQHRVEVSANGYRTFSSEVQVREGEIELLNVSLARAPM